MKYLKELKSQDFVLTLVQKNAVNLVVILGLIYSTSRLSDS